MDAYIGILTILFLGLPILLFVRWIVWRKRFFKLNKSIEALVSQNLSIISELSELRSLLDTKANKRRSKTKVTALETPDLAIASEIVVEPKTPSPKLEAFSEPEISKASVPEEKAINLEKHREADEKAVEAKQAPEDIPHPPKHTDFGRHTSQQVKVISSWTSKIKRELIGKIREKRDWEAIIGGRWLNLVGIVVLIVGMVLLTQQTLLYLGPEEKVIAGVAASFALLAGGILLGKLEGYQLLSWTLTGGGWALLYFTAYASHNVAAARVIDNPILALVFLCTVALGMIVHSFTYRSQLLTILAYGLGFLAITMTPVTLGSLIASGVLAASMIVVLRLMPWYHLAFLGVIGTYLNHWKLIGGVSILQGVSPQNVPPTGLNSDQTFWLSTGILIFYWVLFVALSLMRKPETKDQENFITVSSIANTVGFLSLSLWQIWSYKHGSLFYLTAPASLAYVCTAYLEWRFGRKLLFQINSLVAGVLYFVSLPLFIFEKSITQDWLALYWIIGSIVSLAVGMYSREVVLRIQAYVMIAAIVSVTWVSNLGGPGMDHSPLNDVLVPLTIIFLFAASEWVVTFARSQPKPMEDIKLAGQAVSLSGLAVFVHLCWDQFAPNQLGIVFLVLGLVFLEVGILFSRWFQRLEAYLLLVLSLGTTFIYTFDNEIIWQGQAHFDQWAHILFVVAGLYYTTARMIFTTVKLSRFENELTDAPSFAATLLLFAFSCREIDPLYLAVCWAVWGLLLLECGFKIDRLLLRVQGYGLQVCAAAGAIGLNIYELQTSIGDYAVSRSLLVLGVVTIQFYIYWRTSTTSRRVVLNEIITTVFPLFSATVLLAMLLWKELPSVAVATAWGVLALVYFEIGDIIKRPILRQISHILLCATVVRLFMANFVTPGEALGFSHRLLTVGLIILTMYYLRWRIGEIISSKRDEAKIKLFGLNEHNSVRSLYSYASALLLVVLARFEMGRSLVVVGWAPLLLIFYWIGIRNDDRDFRFQAYIIAALVFARSWSTNVYLIGTLFGIPERIATTIPAIASLYAATFFSKSYTPKSASAKKSGKLVALLQSIESHAFIYFSFLGSGLIAVLIFYQLPINLVSIGWAIEGFVLLLIGFAIKQRCFRLYGLAMLIVCLLKVTLMDLAGVDTIYRILSFILLGVLLLLASLAYTRHRKLIDKYI